MPRASQKGFGLLIEVKCPVCGKPFLRITPRKHTCSRSCGVRLGHRKSGPRIRRLIPGLSKANASKQWATLRQRNWPRLNDKPWLSRKYHDEQMSLEEIGDIIGVSRISVTNAFKRQGIVLRKKTERTERSRAKVQGPNNYHWKGGIYNGKPTGLTAGGNHFRHRQRLHLIAERGNRCEWCGSGAGKTQASRIEMNHIIPFCFSEDGTDGNVELLCVPCHWKADSLFRELAGKAFVSAGCPGFVEARTTLKSRIRTATMPTTF